MTVNKDINVNSSQPLVSVIVPAFNVADTIDACLQSIVMQSYSNLQIIVIDDGSTDRTNDKIHVWRENDKRITLIHEVNSGLSAARNAGICNADGEYIVFIDSDDIVKPTYVEDLLYPMLQYENVDLTIGGIVTDNPLYHRYEVPSTRAICSGKHYLVDHAVSPALYDVVAWSKMYRLSLAKEICFPVGKIHEDEFTFYRYMYQARNIATIPHAEYCYRFNRFGITGSRPSIHDLDIVEALAERATYYAHHQELHFAVDPTVRRMLSIFATVDKELTESSDKNRRGRQLRTLLRQNYRIYVANLSFTTRVAFIVFCTNPHLFGAVLQGTHPFRHLARPRVSREG